jgi:CxxC-x17-CxxC domain-containing protein
VYFADKKLTCKDCGNEFLFTAGEQDFYQQRGFTNEPGRCPDCRTKRKQRAVEVGQTPPDTVVPATTEVTKIVCARCGKETTVPFKPQLARPLYCSDCFTIFKNQLAPAALSAEDARLEKLSKMLADPAENEQLRLEVVWELAESKNKQAIPPLLMALDDENWKIVWAAIEALSNVGDAQSITVLEEHKKKASNEQLEFALDRAIDRIKKRIRQLLGTRQSG